MDREGGRTQEDGVETKAQDNAYHSMATDLRQDLYREAVQVASKSDWTGKSLNALFLLNKEMSGIAAPFLFEVRGVPSEAEDKVWMDANLFMQFVTFQHMQGFFFRHHIAQKYLSHFRTLELRHLRRRRPDLRRRPRGHPRPGSILPGHSSPHGPLVRRRAPPASHRRFRTWFLLPTLD